MLPFFRDYFWKDGKPLGVQKAATTSEETLYRIVSDPYHKWITIEVFKGGEFKNMIYDSRFLDFRKLTPTDQIAWRKQMINETEAWIFNEDDRLILKEVCVFRDDICHEIGVYSPYNTLICRYEMEEGPAGPLTLFDSNAHPVMSRPALSP